MNKMTLAEFEAAFAIDEPPELTPLLVALWHDARGDWQSAHNVAQDIDDATGSWVHAYLHRKEGDLANAAYWYRRAGRPVACGALDAEWRQIAAVLLRAAENRTPTS
jgi:hypothetical protein